MSIFSKSLLLFKFVRNNDKPMHDTTQCVSLSLGSYKMYFCNLHNVVVADSSAVLLTMLTSSTADIRPADV